MPRNYVRKKEGPSYTIEDVENAVADVRNRNKSYREAETFYGVPKSVIYQRIGGRKTALNVTRAGRSQVLSSDVENELVKCLLARTRMGLPCDKAELRKLVGEYVIAKDLKTPFKDGIPGEDWYYLFMRRHPELSLKKPEHLQKLRKDARKPEIVYDFFDHLQRVIDQNDLDDNKGSFIFNADESGFNNDPYRIRAIGEKGKALCRISGGSGRESTTVLGCVSADGKALPPLIVFKGAGVQARWTSERAYPGTLYAASSNGWMEEPQFFHWFSTGLLPHINNLRISQNLPDQAALLLYDGHSSHMSVRIIEEAIRNNIILMKFPSHLTDKLQPLDKCVFGPLKVKWNKQLVKFGKEQMGRGCGRLSKEKFTELLGITWQESMVPNNIISGFKNTGVYPVNREKFPQSEFTPEDLAKYEAAREAPRTVTSDAITLSPKSTEDASSEPNILLTTVDVQMPPFSSCSHQEDLTSTATNQQQPSTSSTDNQQLVPFTYTPQPSATSSISTSTEIANIFMPQVIHQVIVQEPKHVTPRLKQQRYGEVLTTNQVLERLKEAEEKKNKNKRKKNANPKTDSKKLQPKLKKIKISLGDTDEDIDLAEPEKQVIELKRIESSDLSIGKFILVQFKGGKRNTTVFKYVCLIEAVDEKLMEIKVTGLKSWDATKMLFNIVETDISYITMDQIIGMLPDPGLQMKGERILYNFSSTVPVYEQN